MIYLDSTALVKLIHAEEHSAALNRHLAADSAPLVSSEFTRIEVCLALRRRGNGAALKKTEHLLDKIARLPVAEVIRTAGHVASPPPDTAAAPGHGVAGQDRADRDRADPDRANPDRANPDVVVPRVSDALHVATATALGPALSEFITYDAQLARVAADAGLPVVSPGLLLASNPSSQGSTLPA